MTPTVDIERGITRVVEKLGNANLKDLELLTYDPVAVKDKIDEQSDYFIYDEVMTHVTRYFRFIEKQMQDKPSLRTLMTTFREHRSKPCLASW
ncbi:ABC-three component system protein [Alloscardovia sp. HMSC034E08]|uniref:ABC-three component system protein n=1 Tax=Alloscardovia sp. HMSC034E08 TaxID=1739413 RepID=UPI0011D0705B|nr:ABC-three component system protein [Alloscardovia sp. HMSC034E08]